MAASCVYHATPNRTHHEGKKTTTQCMCTTTMVYYHRLVFNIQGVQDDISITYKETSVMATGISTALWNIMLTFPRQHLIDKVCTIFNDDAAITIEGLGALNIPPGLFMTLMDDAISEIHISLVSASDGNGATAFTGFSLY